MQHLPICEAQRYIPEVRVHLYVGVQADPRQSRRGLLAHDPPPVGQDHLARLHEGLQNAVAESRSFVVESRSFVAENRSLFFFESVIRKPLESKVVKHFRKD